MSLKFMVMMKKYIIFDLFLLKKHKSDELDFDYITEQLEILEIGAFSKNIMSLCDVLFTEKSLYCEQNDIKFSVMIDGSRLDFIDDGDLNEKNCTSWSKRLHWCSDN